MKLETEKEKTKQLQKDKEVLEQTIKSNEKLIGEMTESQATNENEILVKLNDDEDENGTMNKKEIYELINRTIPTMIKNTIRVNTNTDNNKNMQQAQCSQQQTPTHKKSAMKQQKIVSFLTPSGENNNKNETHSSNSQTVTQIEMNSNLRPAKQYKQRNENGVHEMYVSKFECDMEIEEIERHITNCTKINPEAFNVELIRSNSTNRPDYVAFKITTLKRHHYEEILDIWGPDLKAREYKAWKQNGNTYKSPGTQQQNKQDITNRIYIPQNRFKKTTNTKQYEQQMNMRTRQNNFDYTPKSYVSRGQYTPEFTPRNFNRNGRNKQNFDGNEQNNNNNQQNQPRTTNSDYNSNKRMNWNGQTNQTNFFGQKRRKQQQNRN